MTTIRNDGKIVVSGFYCPRCHELHDKVEFKPLRNNGNLPKWIADCPGYAGPIFLDTPTIS